MRRVMVTLVRDERGTWGGLPRLPFPGLRLNGDVQLGGVSIASGSFVVESADFTERGHMRVWLLDTQLTDDQVREHVATWTDDEWCFAISNLHPRADGRYAAHLIDLRRAGGPLPEWVES